jgi:hypothetical protein
MSCAETRRERKRPPVPLFLLAGAMLLLLAPGLGAARNGQQEPTWTADGPCGLPAVIEGIAVEDVCNRLAISFRRIYGPDRSPWIEISNTSDCRRLRQELDRLLSASGDGAPPVQEPEQPVVEPSGSTSRPETDLEKWLRQNGFASLQEAQAEREAMMKKFREERAAEEGAAQDEFARQSQFLRDELKGKLAMQRARDLLAGFSKPQTPAVTPEQPGPVATAEEWSAQCSKWIAELDEANKQVESTRAALLKLIAASQADRKLFAEWEAEAQAGLERSKGAMVDLALDIGVGIIVDSIKGWASHVPGYSGQVPDEVVKEYLSLASLAKRLEEAKATRDFAGLAAREGKTEAEVYETMRDGLGQISSIIGLDKTPPGKVWKYGSLLFDQAYNLTALFQVWKNVSALEANNERYAEGINKLTERLHRLMARQQELRQKIEAGEPVEFKNQLHVSPGAFLRDSGTAFDEDKIPRPFYRRIELR